MTKVEQILQKKYKDKVLKLAAYKKKLSKMQSFLKEYGIPCNPKDDISYFRCEVLYESIFNKKRLEDCFLESFVEMQDFWQGLDYKERNHLVHVDIDRKCSDLKYLITGEQKVYMPVFDEHINHIYADEIVNLELKQYRLFTKDFRGYIQDGLYDGLPYKNHFSSAEWIADSDKGYCLYFSKLNRFYLMEDGNCTGILSLDPQRKDRLNPEKQSVLALLFMNHDEKGIAEMILECDCVDERCKKKIAKAMHKMDS